jgi:parvulin-like peptidyl-prolyl isomerase
MVSICGSKIVFADRVVALVGEEKIMESDLESFTANIPAPFKKSFQKKALENIIDKKLFCQLALKAGLDRDREFEKKIKETEQKMLADFYIEKKLKIKINVTDEDVRNYYQQHLDKYSGKARVHVMHLTTDTLGKAKKIKKMLDNGMGFEEILKNPSRKFGDLAGGDLGWLKGGSMPEPFEREAFSLKKGEIGKIINTKIGFHIIKVIDRDGGQKKTLDEVAPRIKKQLVSEKLHELKRLQRKEISIKYIVE